MNAGADRLAARFAACRGRAMKVAFHAPLKAPDHPVPSGDRQLARALLRALRRGRARRIGCVALPQLRQRAATLRDRRGSKRIGERSRSASSRAAGDRGSRPTSWFTYHLLSQGARLARSGGHAGRSAFPTSWRKRRSPTASATARGRRVTRLRSPPSRTADAVICLNPARCRRSCRACAATSTRPM